MNKLYKFVFISSLSSFLSSLLILFLTVTITLSVHANERNDGKYSTIVDESGNTVYITAWKIDVGDQVLTETNRRYEVVSVDGDVANAKFIGEVNLSQYLDTDKGILSRAKTFLHPAIAGAQGKGKVAIYHTHSDESYVPTDGKESILGAGGVYKVGDSFSEALKAKGIDVLHSDAKHDPHDDMAYERSRRTALDMIKSFQPDAIFDVHRDAVPPQVYQANVNGQNVTKVQLVVGKYGPTGKQIEDYALQLKAAADQQHPGLVKGIFFAKGGDYNQDLHPRSMLLEVGSHTNDRTSAEKGIALFADVVPTVIGQTSGGGGAAAGTTGTGGTTGLGSAASGLSGAAKSIGWIIGIVIVGGAAFLLLSTGSLKEAGSKLKQFTTTEFANFFGPRVKKKDKLQSDDRESDDKH
ncbi:MAG TPA: stage II sporulation protein P [Methylomusa anaerophila]|uniref:Stage II sporulation protein P n=1 Tax=Methylomusa anaerophila TaxID=1930071 RepID=A0A348APH8_9FIRM|nr:stage II sporulation protein P [Methylomusa anaerophila]BBB92976.1 Stage II sporulation protein P [Methylomusa anaerophila]HML87190.1 stage II sporulation protein P [Methylomusa anaerophila]